ncbi:MAG: hypothetical protein M5T61_03395 [Acidimicrobiia bacterium]|nr:hypothetical protein [Acidimicrobiia bacterium]
MPWVPRGIDDHLYLRRARGVGKGHQRFDLLCHAIRVNLITQMRYASAPPAQRRVAA